MGNGGALLISGFGGREAYAQAGLLVAALTLVRAPQSVLIPAITNLLPHLSQMTALGEDWRMRRFVLSSVSAVGSVGLALVGGTWLLGEFAMRLVYGSGIEVSRGVLTVLAALAACLLLCELLNQVLFATGLAWAAAGSWLLGLAVTAGLTLASQEVDLLERVSYALAFGAVSTVVAQTLFLLKKSRRRAAYRHTLKKGNS